MGKHVVVGMIIGLKGQGYWRVTNHRDGYVFLTRISSCHETWKVLESRVFI